MRFVTIRGFPVCQPGMMRTCTECGREFAPSSRHSACPACRSKDTCSCGSTKQKKSKQCAACWAQHGQVGSANFNWRGGRTRHHQAVRDGVSPRAPASQDETATSSNTSSSWRRCSDGSSSRARTCTIAMAFGTTTDLENLELWTKPQPSGIRARDAVAWARRSCSYTPNYLRTSSGTRTTENIVEVAGFEPASPGDRLGLLRAQPMHRSHPSVSIGRGPRGQSGCVVPRRPPDRTGGVSLLR